MGLQADALSHIHLHAQYLHSYSLYKAKASLNSMLIFFFLLLDFLTAFTDSKNTFKPALSLTFNVSVSFLS